MAQAAVGKKGDIYQLDGEEFTVQARCMEIRTIGYWLCTAHGMGFNKKNEVVNHTHEEGNHLVVWYCVYHGPEAP